jgi:hypothetical protein
LVIGRNCMTNELFFLFHIDQLEDVLFCYCTWIFAVNLLYHCYYYNSIIITYIVHIHLQESNTETTVNSM